MRRGWEEFVGFGSSWEELVEVGISWEGIGTAKISWKQLMLWYFGTSSCTK
jgi:hypothetical protein